MLYEYFTIFLVIKLAREKMSLRESKERKYMYSSVCNAQKFINVYSNLCCSGFNCIYSKHLFIQQNFIKHLLSAKHSSKC